MEYVEYFFKSGKTIKINKEKVKEVLKTNEVVIYTSEKTDRNVRIVVSAIEFVEEGIDQHDEGDYSWIIRSPFYDVILMT